MSSYVIYKVATILVLLIVKYYSVKVLALASKVNFLQAQSVNYLTSMVLGIVVGVSSIYLGNPTDLVLIVGAIGSIFIFTQYATDFRAIYNDKKYFRLLFLSFITVVNSIVGVGFGAIFVIFLRGV